MKSLLLLPLLVLGARAGPSFTRTYSGVNQTGNYVDFDNYAPDLYASGIDNDIESVYQTGIWMYYENYDYNVETAGRVYYVHGIDLAVNFFTYDQNIMSSLRYAGSPTTLNADMMMFYEGTYFTGSEYYTETDASSLGPLAGTVSSLIMTGTSWWTVYTGEGYTGSALCFLGSTEDEGSNGETLDSGLFPTLDLIFVDLDNSIMSVRKGCFADRVVKAPKLQMDGRQENGAWGRLM